jgi:glycerol-3-phosphate dehydrogenase
MERNLVELTRNSYDLLVIGGGIYGAGVAWDATLRGLSVALVEKADFGSATSANSLKTIHGGLRYLQHADFQRMRESMRERKALMRIAPHLIHPLPVLVPTYGHGLKSKEIMAIALRLNDWIGGDRNWGMGDPQKHIPMGRVISAQECLQYLPGLATSGLTGGAVFYDAQVYNSERLLISFLRSAVQLGARVANYVKVTGFLRTGDRITGVTAEDVLTGDGLEIPAKAVVNTAGPWVGQVINLVQPSAPARALAKAMNVVTRPLFSNLPEFPYAVGISSPKTYQDADAVINKGSRLFFIAPWRGKSLVGTNYSPYAGQPDELSVTDSEIQAFLNEVNQAYPTAQLTLEDVELVHLGLLPSSGIAQSGDVQLTKHYELYDHRRDGAPGLLSVSGVKYTTARDVAAKAMNWVFQYLGQRSPRSTSATVPIYGGQIEQFQEFLEDAIQRRSVQLEASLVRRLVYNYGSAYPEVLKYLEPEPVQADSGMAELELFKAEVRYAVREEMAQKLSDVVMRRTELGSSGFPGEQVLRLGAQEMGLVLGWSSERIDQEVAEVTQWLAGRSGKHRLTNSPTQRSPIFVTQ